ncbi:MAG: hypothetical protein H6555_08755 [Lewinellaceae bacterium]|nr:hypothetical protein [Lewinellaceae bacterium]
MDNSDLDRLLQHFSDSADDEWALLHSTGPEYFSTAQLLHMQGQWQFKFQLFQWANSLTIRIASWAPLWLALGLIFGALRWNILGFLCMALFLLSFFLFLGGLWFIRSWLGGKGALEADGDLLAGELRKRKAGDLAG